jgi:hypothetical protein
MSKINSYRDLPLQKNSSPKRTKILGVEFVVFLSVSNSIINYKNLGKMSKELLINLGGTFVVVLAAIVINEKFIKPNM